MVHISAPGEENVKENPTNNGNLTLVLQLSQVFAGTQASSAAHTGSGNPYSTSGCCLNVPAMGCS